MQSSVGERSRTSGYSANVSLINSSYRKGYEIPVLPYQKNGILSRTLWPSKSHIIRILPGYDEKTGEVFPQNCNNTSFSPDSDYSRYLSDTFYQATVASRFGDISSPVITDYAPGSPDDREWGGETVLHNFIRGIVSACSGKGRSRLHPINEWKIWTKIGPSCTIQYDKVSLLLQALIFRVNDQDNQDYETKQALVDDEGDVLPLLSLVVIDNKQSIANICQALVEPMNPAKPLDAATNNKYGPMAELEGNKMFLNPYTDPVNQRSAMRPSVQAPGEGWTPSPFPIDAEVAKSLWVPWNKLLHYMTAQEQLELCAACFGADTVNYVIGTDPKFCNLPIPDDIKRVGLGARYSSVDGGSITLSSQPAASKGFGKPGLGLGPKAPKAEAPAFNASGLKGVTAAASSSLDLNKLHKLTERINQATKTTANQTALAAELAEGEEE